MSRRLPASIDLRRDPATGRACCPTLDEATRLPAATLDAIHDYLEERLTIELGALPPEGTEHSGAVGEVQDRLRGHYQRVGRGVFIAPNLGVHYPGAPAFAPDLLAVVDVALHHRSTWRVDVEHRGLDFVLEVVVDGKVHKDLEHNVVFYAGLGIPEYMVYLVHEQSLQGWRLEPPSAERYTRIVPQYGRLPSRVLGLEFGVAGGSLRCEAERRRATLRRSILRTLSLRGLEPAEQERAVTERCDDADTLELWDERVLEATSVAAQLDLAR